MIETIVPTSSADQLFTITFAPGQEDFTTAMKPAVSEIARILTTIGQQEPTALQQALLTIATSRYQQAYLTQGGDSEEAQFHVGGDVYALYLMLDRWLHTLVQPPPAGV